jgi:ornithine cyclodeaminase
MKVYAADAVHAALPWAPLAAAIERAFVASADASAAAAPQVPLRHAHALSGSDTLLLMPAWDDALIATKLVTVMPAAPQSVQAQVLVLERATGRALALLDGDAVTVRRTAATSALAAQRLARPDAARLLVVGTGHLAPWMARAHAALRPGLTEIAIWGRDAAKAQGLARTLAAEGLPARPAPNLAEAVVAAHIVCCATTATEPLVKGAWLVPGIHLDLVGAFRKTMREVDDLAIARSRVVVDTRNGALAEAGDLVQPIARGVVPAAHVVAELAELLRGAVAGRERRDQITLFKSVGTALEDLAAARCVLGL